MPERASAADQPSTTPQLSIDDGRALVRLSRPREHNRLEPADLAELQAIFDRVDQDSSIRVLVLTGSGKSFSSGFHIGALADRGAQAEPPDPNAFERTVDRLEILRVPTIAALNGGVYGGATDLALACDFRLGVPAMQMFMPAARLGIVYYPSGLRRYVTRLGLAAAKKLFLTAQPIDADQLLAIGYLDEIVMPAQLMARVEELSAEITANAPMAVMAMKRALNEIAANALDRAVLDEARRRCAASADHKEALAAWAQKRKPRFEGR
jgi:enoyl-CoA hydratase/carnithine racemase